MIYTKLDHSALNFSSNDEVNGFLKETYGVTLPEVSIPESNISNNDMGDLIVSAWKVQDFKKHFCVIGLTEIFQDTEEGQSMSCAGYAWTIADKATGAVVSSDKYLDDYYHAMGKGRAEGYLLNDIERVTGEIQIAPKAPESEPTPVLNLAP